MAASDLMNFNVPCITTLYDIDFSSHQPGSELQSSSRPSLQKAVRSPAAQSPFPVSPAAHNSLHVQQILELPSTDHLVPVPSAMESNASSTTVADSVQTLAPGPAPERAQSLQPDKGISTQDASTACVTNVPSWTQPTNGPAVFQGVVSVTSPEQENASAPQQENASFSELCAAPVSLDGSTTQSGQACLVKPQARVDDLAAGLLRGDAMVAPGDAQLVQQHLNAELKPDPAEMSGCLPELFGARNPQQQQHYRQQQDITRSIPATQPIQPDLAEQHFPAAPNSSLQSAIHQQQEASGPQDISSVLAAPEPCHSKQPPHESAAATLRRAMPQPVDTCSPAPPNLDLTTEQLKRVAVATKVPVSMVHRADQALTEVLHGTRLADPLPPSSADGFIAAALQHMLKAVQHGSRRAGRLHAGAPATSSSRQRLAASAQVGSSTVVSMASSMPSSGSMLASSTPTDHGTPAMHAHSSTDHTSSTPEGAMQPDSCEHAASLDMHASSAQPSRAIPMPDSSSRAQQQQQQHLQQAEDDMAPKQPAASVAAGTSEPPALPAIDLHQEPSAVIPLARPVQQSQHDDDHAESTQACALSCRPVPTADGCGFDGDKDSLGLVRHMQLTASQHDLHGPAGIQQGSGEQSQACCCGDGLDMSQVDGPGEASLHADCDGSVAADAIESAIGNVDNPHLSMAEPDSLGAVEDNSPRAGSNQEAAGSDPWEHINRPCCSDLEEASSPAVHIIMEDAMRPASGQELRNTTNEPRSQVPASRDQQLDDASIHGSDQAADSSGAEAGGKPMARADPSSSQAVAAQASQMPLEQQQSEAAQVTQQPAQKPTSAIQDSHEDAPAASSAADQLQSLMREPQPVSGMLLEADRQIMEASSSMDSSIPSAQHPPPDAAANAAVSRGQVPQRASTFSPGWARRFLDVFRSSEPPAGPASQPSSIPPDSVRPNSHSQSSDVPDVNPRNQGIQVDGLPVDTASLGDNANLLSAERHVDWEHLPRMLVRVAEGSQLNGDDLSPTSQLSWDRMSDMLNESCGEDDQQDTPDHL